MSPPNCCYCFICKKSLSFADGIHFFIFPWKHPQKLQKWFTNLGLADKPNSLQPTLRSHICSLHFQPEDLKRCGKRVRLLPHAIPRLVNNQVKPHITESVELKVMQPSSESIVARLCPRTANDHLGGQPVLNGRSLDSSLSGSALRLKMEASLIELSERAQDAQQHVAAQFVQPFTTTGRAESEKSLQPVAIGLEESPSVEPMHITVEIDPFDIGEDSDNTDILDKSDAESAEIEQKPLKLIARKNLLYPASCAPEDSDSPCKMKKKIAVLYSAYQTLKKRNKTALQSIRRLKKENTTLKTMLEDFQRKEKKFNTEVNGLKPS